MHRIALNEKTLVPEIRNVISKEKCFRCTKAKKKHQVRF